MRAALRHPLLHFTLLGAGLFVLQAALEDPTPDRAPIVVTDDFETELEHRGMEISAGADREALLSRFVREEALYREALRMGLDEGDVIVRRRLVQKMEFLLRSTVELAEPSDSELERYLDDHRDRYRTPARHALVHVFFSRDRRGDAAETDARSALASAGDDGVPVAGDPFLHGTELPLSTEADLAERFGRGFARDVAALPTGAWRGPIPSSYGSHLVRVVAREPERTPALADVRTRVRTDWEEERRQALFEEAVADVVASYPVRSEEPVR